MRFFLYSAIAMFALPACSSLPSAKSIENFGKATASVAVSYKASIERIDDVGQAATLEEAAYRYYQNCRTVGEERPENVAAKCEKMTLTPIHVSLGGEDVDERLAAVTALQIYGSALAEASDASILGKVEAASSNLGSVLGSFAKSLGPLDALASPLGTLVSHAIAADIRADHVSEIRRIMSDTHPAVVELARLIKIDVDGPLTSQYAANVDKLNLRMIVRLIAFRDQSNIDAAVWYEAYMKSSEEITKLRSFENAMPQISRSVDAMVEAHAALIRDQENKAELVSQLTKITSDIELIVIATNQE